MRPEDAGKFFKDITKGIDGYLEIISATWLPLSIMIIVAFTLSCICLCLFRYAALQVVWIFNIAFVFVSVVLALLMFFVYDNKLWGGCFVAIGVILILLIAWFWKRIYLIAKLFKESSKALTDLPEILFEPILVSTHFSIFFLNF